MATYSIADLSRREILRMSATLAAASVASTSFANAQTAERRTPEQILGPYYPLKGFDQNADLTRVPGRPGRAEGQVLDVMGRVFNLKGGPVRNAKVEIWQANAHGRYTHPSDTNPAPLDPNFDRVGCFDHRPRGSLPVQDDQTGWISSGSQQDATGAHSLPNLRPAGQACDPDVFRR